MVVTQARPTGTDEQGQHMTTVLMVISAADNITLADGTPHPTGYWAEEVAASHHVLREAGVEVRIATPRGEAPTADPSSLDADGDVGDEAGTSFRDYLDALGEELTRPLVLADVDLDGVDAVLLPGGHGPMVDLAGDADLRHLLLEADRRGLVVAALCHGPAGLLSATREDGTFLYAGRRLTAFTDEEERAGGLGEGCPYLLETRLRELGAVLETGPAWSSTVVVDGTLVTGQNPQSSVATARAVLTALEAGARV